MFAQAVIVNIAFFLIGFGLMKADPGTARVFIIAVFSEIAAMVFFIVKYLFRPGSDEVLKLAGSKPGTRRSAARGKRVNRLS